MTEVSKASAYPKSVQPGLPRLGSTPQGWSRGPLSEHLFEETRAVRMADDELYDLVTVKRSRGGVVRRERLKGSEIAVKSQFRLRAGDFLISKRQIVHGACGIVPPELDGAIVSNEYAVLRARPSLNLEFLNCLAHSIYFQQTCFHSSIGVHVEKMIFKLESWLKWDFDLPSARDQCRIAEIFSTWNQAIETVEALIINARKQKCALMQALLSGERHLLTAEDSSREWTSCSLGDLFTFKNGLNGEKSLYGSGVKFVNVMDVLRSRTLRHVDIAGSMSVTNSQLAEFGVKRGDILFNRTSETEDEIAISAVYLDDIPAVFGGFVIRARPRADVLDVDFSVYAFQSPSVRRAMMRLGQGGIRSNIGQGDLATVSLTLPPVPEQAKIATILINEDRTIEALHKKLVTLRQEKAALIQQLLTGKRLVSAAESEAA